MTRREWLVAGLAFAPATKSRAVEELVIDAASKRVLHSGFARVTRQPVGSLVKVFTALAYGASHRYAYPQTVCEGTKSGCWYAAGHGRLELVSAIAHSCNAYFLGLARDVTPQDLAIVATSYRIAPPVTDSPEARIGLGRGWLESPEAIALAYLTLVDRRQEPGASLVFEGLRQCARSGTAKACGSGTLAKTGTSVCVHRPAMPGDGWALGMFPEDRPRYAVVVRQHGVPGAIAAEQLARRLAALREGR